MKPAPGESLLNDVVSILGRSPAAVVDVGCHHGATSKNYLDAFPDCELWAFEAERANFSQAREMLAPYAGRAHLSDEAVSDVAGEILLNVNSHDGTHSTFPIGQQRYWGAYVAPVESRPVPSVRLDDVFAGRAIDLLHMDIQGGEMKALMGADDLLRRGAIRLVYIEVAFVPLYEGQPLFWDVGGFLQSQGFRFYSLYDRYYHPNNPATLAWADALFVSSELAEVPEHVAA